ncbi:Myc-type, basic helix-loop-helix (bHLH) domain [Dillenia turbinata]|uniref:Myc-type, basic helix-loop-helix (BHLH) domain n=1 Tax=Dillenia turbinata TaxID=194707 RepID=A0AAN8UG65_9MAGN
MLRNAKNHMVDEKDDDEEFICRNDGSSNKGGAVGFTGAFSLFGVLWLLQRERSSSVLEEKCKLFQLLFQILRDLIPQNDQKRDKASFLLEVVEYIQFLQEKLRLYEGSYQGWSQEPTKSMPWRNDHGPIESLDGHSQVVRNGSLHENNAVATPAMIANAQHVHAVESDLRTDTAYREADYPQGPATQAVSMDMSLQPNIFSPSDKDGIPHHPLQGSVFDAENMSSESYSRFWQSGPCTDECEIPVSAPNEKEEPPVESGEANISRAYSQELLNTLTQVLQTSGVDLSQTSIAVQLDVAKVPNRTPNATACSSKDPETFLTNNLVMVNTEARRSAEVQAHKRLRIQKC